MFVDKDSVEVARTHVTKDLSQSSPQNLLSGRQSADLPDPGPIVCACVEVGTNTILQAVAEHGLTSVDAIGDVTGAGTNCGSCRPELKAFLMPSAPKLAAG